MWDDEFNLRELKIQLKWAGYTEQEIENVMRKEIGRENGDERFFLSESSYRDSNI